MSKEYDLYLEEHKANVRKGFEWIRENVPEILRLYYGNIGDLEHQICIAHDWSKSNREEYDPYDAYFYGGNKSYAVVQEFNYAWLRHIHNNPHHWQYWVLINDDPKEGEIILDMPFEYILEMICDWWAFSWKSENLAEIFKWYEKHAAYMKLSTKTRDTVEYILERIRVALPEGVEHERS